jgi:predicted O-methyltransferase YrrM
MKELFTEMPKALADRMKVLEARDAKDRGDKTPALKRLRQIPPESGAVLATLAASAPEGTMLEIGTSGGYSALWLTLASRLRSEQFITYELLPEKAELARETFAKAEVEEYVDLVHGDARGHISDHESIAFCFLDSEKEMYEEFFELVVPKLMPGGLLVADNLISHKKELSKFLKLAHKDKTVDALILHVGKGLLLVSKKAVK